MTYTCLEMKYFLIRTLKPQLTLVYAVSLYIDDNIDDVRHGCAGDRGTIIIVLGCLYIYHEDKEAIRFWMGHIHMGSVI